MTKGQQMKCVFIRFCKGCGWFVKTDYDNRTKISPWFATCHAAKKWCDRNNLKYNDYD